MASADQKLKPDSQKNAADNSVDKEFKVAQSLDQNELNNLSTSSNLESLSSTKSRKNFHRNVGSTVASSAIFLTLFFILDPSSANIARPSTTARTCSRRSSRDDLRPARPRAVVHKRTRASAQYRSARGARHRGARRARARRDGRARRA